MYAVAPVRRSGDNLWVVLNIRLIGSHLDVSLVHYITFLSLACDVDTALSAL